jgi:hypothetical protein
MLARQKTETIYHPTNKTVEFQVIFNIDIYTKNIFYLYIYIYIYLIENIESMNNLCLGILIMEYSTFELRTRNYL